MDNVHRVETQPGRMANHKLQRVASRREPESTVVSQPSKGSTASRSSRKLPEGVTNGEAAAGVIVGGALGALLFGTAVAVLIGAILGGILADLASARYHRRKAKKPAA